MRRWLCLIAITELMTGCASPEVVPPPQPPLPEPQLIFELPLLGEITKTHFATITLYRDSVTQTRIVLLAKEPLEQATLSLALPNCLAPVGADPKTTWEARGLAVGEHTWTQGWRQTRTKCVGNGTLLYAVSSRYYGDRGSIPFDWDMGER